MWFPYNFYRIIFILSLNQGSQTCGPH